MPLPTFHLNLETTGLNPFRDAVVEVGLRGPRDFEAVVSDGPRSTAAAERAHGLTPERVRAEGQPGRQVLLNLLHALGPGPVRIVAHGADTRRDFLEAWALRESLELPRLHWECTLTRTQLLLGEAPLGHGLGDLARALGWAPSVLHRAGPGAALTRRLDGALGAWEALQARFREQTPVLYLAGPLRGDGSAEAIRANQAAMLQRARWVQAVLPKATLVVPHGNFAYVDESGPGGHQVRSQVLASCEKLVRLCDALLQNGEVPTEGVRREREAALAHGLPIHLVPGWDGPVSAASSAA
ncbi:MAG TPA: 3'-5' exonuclease [Holophagaceae bacterium]|nr:3'-5' exonuclease [Holophagaceae bacterium]